MSKPIHLDGTGMNGARVLGVLGLPAHPDQAGMNGARVMGARGFAQNAHGCETIGIHGK